LEISVIERDALMISERICSISTIESIAYKLKKATAGNVKGRNQWRTFRPYVLISGNFMLKMEGNGDSRSKIAETRKTLFFCVPVLRV